MKILLMLELIRKTIVFSAGLALLRMSLSFSLLLLSCLPSQQTNITND